jgi:hypothetical protein
VLGLYSLYLKNSLRRALWCRYTQEINICNILHKLYFIKCIGWLVCVLTICHVSSFLSERLSYDSFEANVSETSVDFSFKLLMTVPWKHFPQRNMYSVFTRQLRRHAPLPVLTDGFRAQVMIQRLWRLSAADGSITLGGVVSSHGCPLECADVLFTERGRLPWRLISLSI